MPSLIEALALELAKLPPEVIQLVMTLVREVTRAEDPGETAKRALIAAAGERTSEELLERLLK